MTAYMLYAKYRRPQIRKIHGALSVGEISRIMSIEWRDELSPAKKKRYENEHKRLRVAYDKNMKRYLRNDGAAKWATAMKKARKSARK